MFTIAVSGTVCGNQEVVGSNPIAPLLGVVAQLAERLIEAYFIYSLQLYSNRLVLSFVF